MAEDKENVIPDEALAAARARMEAEREWRGRPAEMTPELREEVAKRREEMLRQQDGTALRDQTEVAQAPQPEPEPKPESAPELASEPAAPVAERPFRPRRSER